jgi:uncharacterized phage infection (PIP) family protein YhgE
VEFPQRLQRVQSGLIAAVREEIVQSKKRIDEEVGQLNGILEKTKDDLQNGAKKLKATISTFDKLFQRFDQLKSIQVVDDGLARKKSAVKPVKAAEKTAPVRPEAQKAKPVDAAKTMQWLEE